MAFIDDVIISGFIGAIFSECIDVSWSKIKEADKNRKSKNQNLQTRIYQVIVDVINEMTYNKYEGEDALYDVAENLLNDFKSDNNNRIEVVKHRLSTLISNMDNDKGAEFIGLLRTEISKECNFDLYKEILVKLIINFPICRTIELSPAGDVSADGLSAAWVLPPLVFSLGGLFSWAPVLGQG